MEPIKIKDFLDYHFLSGLALSPDGRTAGFVVHRADLSSNGYHSGIWVADIQTGNVRCLTAMNAEKGIAWLDNKTVLFPNTHGDVLKKEREAGEEWTEYSAIDIRGGEAVAYMRVPLAVTELEVIDRDTFLFTAIYHNGGARPQEASAAAAARLLEEKEYEVTDEIPFIANGKGYINKQRNRLYLFDRKTGKANAVSTPLQEVAFFSSGGGKILYLAKTYADKLPRTDGLYEYRIASGETKTVLEEGSWRIDLAGYMDSKIVTKMTDQKRFGEFQNADFYVLEPDGPRLLCSDDFGYPGSIASDSRYGDGRSCKIAGGKLYYISTRGTASVLCALSSDGTAEILTAAEGSVDCFDVAADSIAFVGMRELCLQELYVLHGKKETCLSQINGEINAGKVLSRPEHFLFENGGVKLDGYVMKPPGCEEGKSYPAILHIHGGPKMAFGAAYYHEMQVWAGMGYYVLFCNPRGSDGKGNRFADIRGRYGTVDYGDLMTFCDVCLEKYPQIDKDRMGVTGGSYGGFMTNWIIGHTNRFRCAAAQRGISNWVSMFGTTDIGYFFAGDQLGATPWNGVERMWEQSPLKYADRVSTPTLFIHSDQDYRCWLPEAFQMFTALKYHGVPARMVVFKGENHELSRGGRPAQRIRRMEEIADWMDSHLKSEEGPVTERRYRGDLPDGIAQQE